MELRRFSSEIYVRRMSDRDQDFAGEVNCTVLNLMFRLPVSLLCWVYVSISFT